MFDGCPKRFYHLRVAKDFKPEDSEASLAGTRDHKALEDRLREGTPLPPHLAKHEDKCTTILSSGMEVIPEQELAITKEFKPCDWWHPDVFLRVKADVALYSATTAAALDWKTGKRRPKPFQLELAALTQFTSYPTLTSTRAAFLWLRENASDNYTYKRDKDYARIQDKLMTKVEKVEDTLADGVWQAKPGHHCNWCEVRNHCSYSQARK